MSAFERGIVKFFDSRVEKRFGFILLPSGKEVFFHFNDGAPVEINATGPVLNMTLRTREPQKGDSLFFQWSKNPKGDKAAPWCFATDWEGATEEVARRPVYRLTRQKASFRTYHKPITVWEGHDLDNLRQRFGQIRLGITYIPGTDDREEYWFERKVGGVDEWEPLEADQDPRQLPRIEQVRVVKPSMPLEFAKRNLKAALRNTTVDRYHMTASTSIRWVSAGKNIAYGYIDDDGKRVTTEETGEYARTTFESRDAQELIELGKPGKVKQCDNDYPLEVDGIYHGEDHHDYRFHWQD